jgi:hypothetical protein
MTSSSFPVLLDHDFRVRTAQSLRDVGSCLSCVGVPRAMLAEHLEQCYLNHGVGLDVLARKGGLAASECLAILEDRGWLPMKEAEAHNQLVCAVLDWQLKTKIF